MIHGKTPLSTENYHSQTRKCLHPSLSWHRQGKIWPLSLIHFQVFFKVISSQTRVPPFLDPLLINSLELCWSIVVICLFLVISTFHVVTFSTHRFHFYVLASFTVFSAATQHSPINRVSGHGSHRFLLQCLIVNYYKAFNHSLVTETW